MSFSRLLLVFVALSISVRSTAAPDELDLSIPWERFTLDNGLTLIVHEDRKAPVVAVNVWYHVGSKDEKPGKTGFAHLFEHLMFNGSEHFNDDYFQALERVGATGLNGTTSFDRTNYFQTVPASAVDMVLWLESDRMGHLLGAIDQGKLDEQRGVVQNEKRQGENRPYGKVYSAMLPRIFPSNHPYSWNVIGSMEDLNAASLDDVYAWFREYYGASNATIVLAGDISAADALKKVRHYFGDIRPGSPVTRQKTWVAKRRGVQRMVLQDQVPQVMLGRTWNIPGFGSADSDYLAMAAAVLSTGKRARLYKRLVIDEQLATSVSASASAFEIAGLFTIQAMLKPDAGINRVNAIIDEELSLFQRKGPTDRELKKARMQFVGNFVRGAERVGGFGGKSDLLAQGQTYLDDPDYYRTRLQRLQSATRQNIQRSVESWLSDGELRLEVHPFGALASSEQQANRDVMPVLRDFDRPSFPPFQRMTLDNGLKVIVAERRDVPLVQLRLLAWAGFARDPEGRSGLASLTLSMLDEGTKTRDALEISDELALLGATLSVNFDRDLGGLGMSALSTNLDQSLALFADVVMNPAFPEADLARQKQHTLAAIGQEKADPSTVGVRLMPAFLYGKNHPYGRAGTGSGTETTVSAIARDDLVAFHRRHVTPANATLIVVGDTTAAGIKPKLERLFRDWKNTGNNEVFAVPDSTGSGSQRIFMVDRPGAAQSSISASNLAPRGGDADSIAAASMNQIIGGSFTSRINMNLREQKHWSYGARTSLYEGVGQQVFAAQARVQSDKTAQSMAEIRRELLEYVGSRPASDGELEQVRVNRLRRLPGSWESLAAVAASLRRLVLLDLPDDYFERYVDSTLALTTGDMARAAGRYIKPDDLIWFIVGDKEKISVGICELDWGAVTELDSDGNVVTNAAMLCPDN